MKYIIDVKEIEAAPTDWVSKESWPGLGLYRPKTETFSMYYVSENGVSCLSYPDELLKTPYKEQGEAVSESLLLKAIAAASRAEVLK